MEKEKHKKINQKLPPALCEQAAGAVEQMAEIPQANEPVEEFIHWADQHARKVVERSGKKKEYVCAAGITPSGPKHIGNYREIITVDMVSKAIQDTGNKVRFIYSWDSFDRFRKVPADVPKEMKPLMEQQIGMPDAWVVDPWKCHDNWARHWEEKLEAECKLTGVNPEFLYQDKLYEKCTYADGIRTAMRARVKVAEILSKFKTKSAADQTDTIKDTNKWYPLFVFCEKCRKDADTEILDYDEEYTITYVCKNPSCNNFKNTIDFRKKGIVKPPWRVDWPMRWHFYKEDFEPGGKDHFNAGSSYDTGKVIITKVYKYPEPYGFMYDFVSAKGRDSGKMSASKGDVITVTTCLEIYTPEVLRFLFAGTKPNKEFAIAFDDEVIKVYEDFYVAERAYFENSEKEKIENEKKKNHLKRVYRFSMPSPQRGELEIPKQMPIQPSFRFLSDLVQIIKGSEKEQVEEIRKKLQEMGHIPVKLSNSDLDRLNRLIKCAKIWAEKYAPQQLRLKLQEKVHAEIKSKLSGTQKLALNNFAVSLKENEFKNEDQLSGEIKNIIQQTNIAPKEFFQACYLAMLGREQGPKLAAFILAVGKEKVAELLETA